MLVEHFYCSVATNSMSMVNVNKHEVQGHKGEKRALGGTVVGSNAVLEVIHV